MELWGIESPDPALVYALINIEVGQKYINLMYSGTYYSICHGAGRVRSRRATKQLITVDEFAESMKVGTDEEIVVNQRTLESILNVPKRIKMWIRLLIRSLVLVWRPWSRNVNHWR